MICPESLMRASTLALLLSLASSPAAAVTGGGRDGILGTNTRDALRPDRPRLGLPADAWPTLELLEAL